MLFKNRFVLLVFIIALLSSSFASCSKKDYLFREVDLGMAFDEIKRNETADLKGTYDIGGTYSKKLYYECYDDEFANGAKVTFEYFFNSQEELNKISVYYHGSMFDNETFFEKTKREIDSKHGYISEKYTNIYDGYKWECGEYRVYLVYWEDGYVLLEYYKTEDE